MEVLRKVPIIQGVGKRMARITEENESTTTEEDMNERWRVENRKSFRDSDASGNFDDQKFNTSLYLKS